MSEAIDGAGLGDLLLGAALLGGDPVLTGGLTLCPIQAGTALIGRLTGIPLRRLDVDSLTAGTALSSVSLSFAPITRTGTVTFTGTALAEPGIRQPSRSDDGPVLARTSSLGW